MKLCSASADFMRPSGSTSLESTRLCLTRTSKLEPYRFLLNYTWLTVVGQLGLVLRTLFSLLGFPLVTNNVFLSMMPCLQTSFLLPVTGIDTGHNLGEITNKGSAEATVSITSRLLPFNTFFTEV